MIIPPPMAMEIVRQHQQELRAAADRYRLLHRRRPRRSRLSGRPVAHRRSAHYPAAGEAVHDAG